MNKLYGIVSCDVVDSTSLSTEGFKKLRRDITDGLFEDLKVAGIKHWGRVVRGDTIELCLENPNYALLTALAVKSWFKLWAAGNADSELMRESGIRYSIGIGDMRYIDLSDDIMDGEAIYMAGRNLDYISAHHISSAFGIANINSEFKMFERVIDNNLMLLDFFFERMNSRQCAVVYRKLLGEKEEDIAELLSISQTAVNLRSRNAGWPLIRESLRTFSKIVFEDYV